MKVDLIEASKIRWNIECENSYPGDENIKIGCLQRIAKAADLMAENHQLLIEERDKYKRWYEEGNKKKRQLLRRISGYKGTITRLKRESL